MISMSRVIAVYRHDYAIKPPPAPTRLPHQRIDWDGMRRQADHGIIPIPDGIGRDRPVLLATIHDTAKTGNLAGLIALPIGKYNSTTRALTKYRSICVTALQAREVQP